MSAAMLHPRRTWPSLTQFLVCFACLAGCHGQEPLSAKLHDPLRAGERDVDVPGISRGAAGSAPLVPTRPTRRPSGEGGTSVAPVEGGSGGVAGFRSPPKGMPMIDYVDAGSASGPAGRGGGFAGWGGTTTWCGNGTIDPGEICEPVNLNGMSCASLGYTGGGLLTCSMYCNYDVSQCRLQPIGPDQSLDAAVIDDDAGVAQP
jgi:hypothetical protein